MSAVLDHHGRHKTHPDRSSLSDPARIFESTVPALATGARGGKTSFDTMLVAKIGCSDEIARATLMTVRGRITSEDPPRQPNTPTGNSTPMIRDWPSRQTQV